MCDVTPRLCRVTDVWVDGDRLLRNRTLTTIDAAAVAKVRAVVGQCLCVPALLTRPPVCIVS